MPKRAWHGVILRERDPHVDECRGTAGNESPIPDLEIRIRAHDAFIQVTTRIANQRFRVGISEYLYTLESSAVSTGQSCNNQFISQVRLVIASSKCCRSDDDPHVQPYARELRRGAHHHGGADDRYAPAQKNSEGGLVVENHFWSGDAECRSSAASLLLRVDQPQNGISRAFWGVRAGGGLWRDRENSGQIEGKVVVRSWRRRGDNAIHSKHAVRSNAA